MRVVLSTYRPRVDVLPPVALAVQLRSLGAEVRVCAPPEDAFTGLLARVGMPLVPAGPSVRERGSCQWAAGSSRQRWAANQYDEPEIAVYQAYGPGIGHCARWRTVASVRSGGRGEQRVQLRKRAGPAFAGAAGHGRCERALTQDEASLASKLVELETDLHLLAGWEAELRWHVF